MNRAYNQFKLNIDSIKTLDAIYSYFKSNSKAIDISEVLRAEFVLIVSALDCFIHDVVRTGMLDVILGKRTKSKKFEAFRISMNAVEQILNSSSKTEQLSILSLEIKKVSSYDSYQKPSSIENALALISVKDFWNQVGKKMKVDPNDIKSQLSLIIQRRNKIAHESDIDHLTQTKFPIDQKLVIESLQFSEKLVEAIYSIVK